MTRQPLMPMTRDSRPFAPFAGMPAAHAPLHLHPRGALRRMAIPVLALVALGAGLATTVALVRDPSRADPQPLAGLDEFAAFLGLGIDQASVTGHRFTLDSDILDALDLARARSFLAFDVAAARRSIEALPWIESAEIARVLPGRIAVTVKERKPFALWRDDAKSYLVDVAGRVLGITRPEDAPADLPRIAGEGAPAEAAALYSTLSRYPTVRERLVGAERIGGRRWALRLSGNVLVELPPDREALVLESLEAGGALSRLIDGQDRVVDMRASGRVAVRPAVPSQHQSGSR